MVTDGDKNEEGTFVGLRSVDGKLYKLMLVEKKQPDGDEEANLNTYQKGTDWEGLYNDQEYEKMVSNFLDGSPAFNEWWGSYKEMMSIFYGALSVQEPKED